MNNPQWVNTLLELKNSKEPSEYFSLNDVAFEKLRECRTNGNRTIKYKTIREKLCPHFSITKTDCMKLLKHFRNIGKIEFVKQVGVRIL